MPNRPRALAAGWALKVDREGGHDARAAERLAHTSWRGPSSVIEPVAKDHKPLRAMPGVAAPVLGLGSVRERLWPRAHWAFAAPMPDARRGAYMANIPSKKRIHRASASALITVAHVAGQDLVPAPRVRGRRSRLGQGRRGVPHARISDRQGREDRRAAPQQRCSQEVPRRASALSSVRRASGSAVGSASMETRLLIRGEQVAGEGPGLAIENPATEETLTELHAASPEQVEAAIAGAREAAAAGRPLRRSSAPRCCTRRQRGCAP